MHVVQLDAPAARPAHDPLLKRLFIVIFNQLSSLVQAF
jgi:hypothetical protein